MTAIDQPFDAAAETSQGITSQGITSQGVTSQGGATDGKALPEAGKTRVAPLDRAEDEQIVLRIEHLPRDVGWMLVYVGVLGVVLPGIIGAPFLLAGAAVLVPGGTKRLSRWVRRNPSPVVHASLKQLDRMLDDLDRRYPRLP